MEGMLLILGLNQVVVELDKVLLLVNLGNLLVIYTQVVEVALKGVTLLP